MALLRVLWIVFKQIVLFFFSGEYYLGYKKFDLKGVSWYNLLHPECIKEVQSKHRLSKYLATFLSSYHETSCDWSVPSKPYYLTNSKWISMYRLLCTGDTKSEHKLKCNSSKIFFLYSGRPNFFSNKCVCLSEKENVWSRRKFFCENESKFKRMPQKNWAKLSEVSEQARIW